MSSRGAQVQPPKWPTLRLDEDRQKATQAFRDERLREPLELYLELFEVCRDAFDELLETTIDLTQLYQAATPILTSEKLFEALRYLSGPPISLDDLLVCADAPSCSAQALQSDPTLAERIVATVLTGLDRQRFPWVSLAEAREPTAHERSAAVLASSALMATSRVQTHRRNSSKAIQEERVRRALTDHGLREVERRRVTRHVDAPRAGEFCMESTLGTRKADLIVGLWDGRIMPIECKVSNSATNSIKRLNNDAAVKAETWRADFGSPHVVPVAILSGVYKLLNLEDAQDRGLTLVWAHSVSDLLAFIDETRPLAEK